MRSSGYGKPSSRAGDGLHVRHHGHLGHPEMIRVFLAVLFWLGMTSTVRADTIPLVDVYSMTTTSSVCQPYVSTFTGSSVNAVCAQWCWAEGYTTVNVNQDGGDCRSTFSGNLFHVTRTFTCAEGSTKTFVSGNYVCVASETCQYNPAILASDPACVAPNPCADRVGQLIYAPSGSGGTYCDGSCEYTLSMNITVTGSGSSGGTVSVDECFNFLDNPSVFYCQ